MYKKDKDAGWADDADGATKVSAKIFMDMVWKNHAEVSYNYVGTYAIMLYCKSKAKGEDKYDDHKNTDGAYQVAESCLKNSKADGSGKDYDACFNDLQQKAINKYRYNHEVDAV